jgi:hypothetical protein
MQMLQRKEIRERFALEGNFVSDLARTCCCICCTLVQADKEAEYQLLHNAGMDMTQPKKKDGMSYEAAVVTPAAVPAPENTQTHA